MPSRTNLAKIHIAVKDLGLSDQVYRDILWIKFRKRSAADISDRQAFALLEDFKRRGWKPRPAKKAKTVKLSKEPVHRKIRALWLDLKTLGVLRDSSEKALNSYVKRITGIDRMEWLQPWQERKVVESLKKWAERERQTEKREGSGDGAKRG